MQLKRSKVCWDISYSTVKRTKSYNESNKGQEEKGEEVIKHFPKLNK